MLSSFRRGHLPFETGICVSLLVVPITRVKQPAKCCRGFFFTVAEPTHRKPCFITASVFLETNEAVWIRMSEGSVQGYSVVARQGPKMRYKWAYIHTSKLLVKPIKLWYFRHILVEILEVARPIFSVQIDVVAPWTVVVNLEYFYACPFCPFSRYCRSLLTSSL